MGNQNQIKSKLLEMEGGKFQRLCENWLYREGFKNIHSIGMMKTTDRVVKGTPDCLIMQENGKYIFAECTVQQKRLANKLEDDISKCFDEARTGIPIDKISKIIIFYLGKLTTKEINKLKILCDDRRVELTLNGLDSISLSIEDSHPVLSETHLGLPLDTGQLLSVEDFIVRYEKSNFTTSIDNELLFSDDLLSNATKTLETANFLLVSGAAGLGKTLFSVTLAKKLQRENNDLNIICLFDKGADLVRDITAYFSEPGEYLIFVDDANELGDRLDYILHYLNEDDEKRTFRIVATVRDYARNSLIEKVNKCTKLHEQVITPLTDDQIKELSETLFGIKNRKYQKRIQEVSCGNPRLAVMISRVAIKTNQIQSIQNVTSLYKDYFGKNKNVKQVVDDKKLIIVACAISFFRKIDKLNEKQMRSVESSFGIQSEEFWKLVDVLHKNKIVDLYENKVAKMSDQVLSTYLFYIAVFEKKAVAFSSIVNNFYPNYTGTIIDSLNPVISAFDQNKIIAEIRNEIKKIFDEFSESKGVKESIEFLTTFSFALPTESLLFAKNLIEKMPTVEVDWSCESFEEPMDESSKASLVSLLTNFRFYGEQEFKISFDLLVKYLVKDKSSLSFVIRALLGKYNFKLNDRRYAYLVQKYIIDTLISLMDRGENYLFSRLFILIANSFLKVEHEGRQWSRGDTMSLITFRLHPDEHLLSLREKIVANIAVLAVNPEFKAFVLACFKGYVDRIRYGGKEMAEADLPFFERHFIKTLNKNNLAHCMIMQNYCDHLESLELSFQKDWRKEFFNETIELSNLLLEDRHKRRILEMSHEEYDQYRHQSLVAYFSDISTEGFIGFIEKCKELHEVLSGRDRDYLFKNGLEMSLLALAEPAREIYPELVSVYLEYDDHFKIDPNLVVSNLLKNLSSTAVLSLLTNKEYKRKKLWLSVYFAQLPEASIGKNESDLLVDHICNVTSNELHERLDYLDKYKHADTAIYSKVVRVLVDKSKEDLNYARPLIHLFSNYSTIFGKWFDEFLPDKELVFDAYLAAFNLEPHWDYSGDALKLLLNERFDFLYKLIDQVYEKEKWPDSHTDMPALDFLWERENYLEDIEGYAKYLQCKDEHPYRYRENIFGKLFTKEEGEAEPEGIFLKKGEFFRISITNNADDIKFMCFIFNATQHLGEDLRRELLELFINANTKFEDFRALDYELTTQSWWGSQVPILEREKSFLESLLPLFNSIKLLEHKSYIEKQIEDKLKSIEDEKKRDYLESG